MESHAMDVNASSKRAMTGWWQKAKLASNITLLFLSIYVLLARESVGWFVAMMQFVLGVNLVMDSVEITKRGEKATGGTFLVLGLLLMTFGVFFYLTS